MCNMVRVLSLTLKQWELKVNISKTTQMVIGKGRERKITRVELDNQEIE